MLSLSLRPLAPVRPDLSQMTAPAPSSGRVVEALFRKLLPSAPSGTLSPRAGRYTRTKPQLVAGCTTDFRDLTLQDRGFPSNPIEVAYPLCRPGTSELRIRE